MTTAVEDNRPWDSSDWPFYRGGCSAEVDCNALTLFGAREAGCFREVAA